LPAVLGGRPPETGGDAIALSNATGSGNGSATAVATGGAIYFPGHAGTANATANSSLSNGGTASATATGGEGNGCCFNGVDGGAAIANASATDGGPAVAVATGGNGGRGQSGGSAGNGGVASAIATSTAMQGGTANATAAATGGNAAPGGIIGTANATSFAATINGNLAQAQSTASGSSGQAKATGQTNIGNLSIQPVATSQVGGSSPAIANAQAGGSVLSPPNTINAGQSFSVASGFAAGPFTIALGSMGAGGIGTSLTYAESATFDVNVATDHPIFTFDLLDNKSLGKGFDSATFQISENGTVLENHLFTDLASAQAFFSNNLINLTLLAGLNIVQLSFNEMISGGDGFAFDYAAIAPTPPPTLPLFASGLVGLGLLGWRRKKKAVA